MGRIRAFSVDGVKKALGQGGQNGAYGVVSKVADSGSDICNGGLLSMGHQQVSSPRSPVPGRQDAGLFR